MRAGVVVLVWLAVVDAGCRRAPPSLARIDAELTATYPALAQWSTAELDTAMRGPASPLLLDVREPAEFEVGHLAGARQVAPGASIAALRAGPLAGVDLDHPIVCYCAVGVRSARLCDRLRRAGYRRATNLRGSIFAWANEDRPVYRGDRRVERVHPYDRRWGTLLRPERRAPLP